MENTFSYRAMTKEGTIQSGTITAPTKDDVLRKIKNLGYTPISVQMNVKVSRDIGGDLKKRKIKLKHLKVFCKQMETMLNAGLSLNKALTILSQQSENKYFREILKAVSDSIHKGSSLSLAMKEFPKAFPELMITLTEAGEKTGRLDEVMGRLAIQYEKEMKVNSKLRSAMIYPSVLGFVTVIAVIVIMVFVVPTFSQMFESNNMELPVLTRLVISLSNFIKHFWWLIFTFLVVITIGLQAYYRTPNGRRYFDKKKLTFWMIKGSMIRIYTALFTRTLSTLLSSGVPLIESLTSAASTTSNFIVMDKMEAISDDLRKGGSMSKLLVRSEIFPPMMTSMVAIGEESGALDDMLKKTADFYDDELEDAMQRLLATIEPVMIVIMGVIIGLLVAAVMLPIFDMGSTVQ